MEPSITSVELQRVCRAWEMNNGYAGWKEFLLFTFLHLDDTHDEWVLRSRYTKHT